jgi:hypothetical protein
MPNLIVDTARVLKRFDRHPVGINLDYLWDSDANRPAARPIAEALREMGVSWLRYPGGGKSDMHLWSAPPWDAPAPRVFGPYRKYGEGAALMDFDEYIATCRAVGAEPFVVAACCPEETSGIGRAEYVENAVEWVRYANVQRDYGVRYWEIGNENWMNDQIAPEAMAEAIAEYATAMRAVDPGIRIGSNGFGTEWWSRLLPAAAKHLDFLTLSNYPCSCWWGYEHYRDNPEVTVDEQVQIASAAIDALPEADRERLFIIVTELNSMDYAEKDPWPNRNNLGHALVTVEIFGRILTNPRVRAAMLWNTRWVDPEPETIWYGLGRENEILPSGRATAVWGRFLGDELVHVDRTDSIVTFATRRGETGEVNVLLINKADSPQNVTLALPSTASQADVYRLAGTGPDDMVPTWTGPVGAALGDGEARVELPLVSLTVLSAAGQ